MANDKQRLVNGMLWTAVGKYSPMVVSIAVSMVLARLLAPSEFGTVALASVVLSFLSVLSSMGIAPAIIQRKDLSNEDLDNIFSFTCYIAAFLSVILFCCSWPIGYFYENNDVISVCQVLSISLFFNTINMVPNALMSNNLRFKENAKRGLILQLITGPISVVAAYLGCGIYALLVAPVITAIGIFLYNHNFYPVKFILRFKMESVKKIKSYFVFQFLFQVINFFTGNIDKLVIGKYLGSDGMGYYQQANQLVQLPTSNISSVVYPVMHPIFSAYQDDRDLLIEKYTRIIQLLAAITFPLAIFLYFSGVEIIHLFYGAKWDNSVEAFQIMSLAVPFMVILPVTGTFFQASNEIKYLFKIGLVNAIVAITTVFFVGLCAPTIANFALGVLFINMCNMVVTYYYMFVKASHTSIFRPLKMFVPYFGVAIFLAVILYTENIAIGNFFYLNFVIKLLSTLVVSILVIHFLKLYDIKNLVRNIYNKTRWRN